MDKLCNGHVPLTPAVAIPFNLKRPTTRGVCLTTELPTEVTACEDRQHGWALQRCLAQPAGQWPPLPAASHCGRGHSVLAVYLYHTVLAGSVTLSHLDIAAAVLSYSLPITELTTSRHHPIPLRRTTHAALHSHPGPTAGGEAGR